MGHYRIGVLEGDHIGPEIVPIAVDVLNEASRACGVSLAFEQLPVGLAAHDRLGTTLPDGTVRALERLDAWVLGPVTTHLYTSESMINPSGFLRKHFDLYANVRPIASRPGVESLRPDIDLVIVRENTEGFYSDRNVLDGNGEFRPNADTVVSVRVTNRRACRRIAEYAFGLASRRRKRLVTAVHKANIFRHGCGMFLEECRKAQTAHPDVQLNDYHVDAFAMHLIRSPQLFDVVVTTNLFGDILSDEAAGLIGGLGLAPSLNVGDHFAMAQAAHGSAPDLAGRGVANPCALILSSALLLDWLGHRHRDPTALTASAAIQRAVATTLAEGRNLTPDLGGDGTTRSLGLTIMEHLAQPHGS